MGGLGVAAAWGIADNYCALFRGRLLVRLASRLLVAAVCVLAGLLPVEARRVALVVGNSDYRLGRLTNPANDAEAVAEVLQGQLKFDQVILRKDLRLDGF